MAMVQGFMHTAARLHHTVEFVRACLPDATRFGRGAAQVLGRKIQPWGRDGAQRLILPIPRGRTFLHLVREGGTCQFDDLVGARLVMHAFDAEPGPTTATFLMGKLAARDTFEPSGRLVFMTLASHTPAMALALEYLQDHVFSGCRGLWLFLPHTTSPEELVPLPRRVAAGFHEDTFVCFTLEHWQSVMRHKVAVEIERLYFKNQETWTHRYNMAGALYMQLLEASEERGDEDPSSDWVHMTIRVYDSF